MKKYAVLLILTISFLLHSQHGFAQTGKDIDAIKEDIKGLKEGQKAMQKEIQEIKGLLKAKQAPAPPEFKEAIINIEGDLFKGDSKAKLAIVEFSDYQ